MNITEESHSGAEVKSQVVPRILRPLLLPLSTHGCLGTVCSAPVQVLRLDKQGGREGPTREVAGLTSSPFYNPLG